MTAHSFENCPAKVRLEALEDWQVRQNGSLERIEKKVDHLLYWLLGGLFTLLVTLLGILLPLVLAR